MIESPSTGRGCRDQLSIRHGSTADIQIDQRSRPERQERSRVGSRSMGSERQSCRRCGLTLWLPRPAIAQRQERLAAVARQSRSRRSSDQYDANRQRQLHGSSHEGDRRRRWASRRGEASGPDAAALHRGRPACPAAVQPDAVRGHRRRSGGSAESGRSLGQRTRVLGNLSMAVVLRPTPRERSLIKPQPSAQCCRCLPLGAQRRALLDRRDSCCVGSPQRNVHGENAWHHAGQARCDRADGRQGRVLAAEDGTLRQSVRKVGCSDISATDMSQPKTQWLDGPRGI